MSEGEPLQSKSGRRHAALDVAPVELYSLCPPVYHLMYVEGGRGSGQPDTYSMYTTQVCVCCFAQFSHLNINAYTFQEVDTVRILVVTAHCTTKHPREQIKPTMMFS